MILRKKEQTKIVALNIVLLASLFILFLAGSVVFGYWYVFGTNNPLKPKQNATQNTRQKGFVYPQNELNNVIKRKIFSND